MRNENSDCNNELYKNLQSNNTIYVKKQVKEEDYVRALGIAILLLKRSALKHPRRGI